MPPGRAALYCRDISEPNEIVMGDFKRNCSCGQACQARAIKKPSFVLFLDFSAHLFLERFDLAHGLNSPGTWRFRVVSVSRGHSPETALTGFALGPVVLQSMGVGPWLCGVFLVYFLGGADACMCHKAVRN